MENFFVVICLALDHIKYRVSIYFVVDNSSRNLKYVIRIPAFSSTRSMKHSHIQTTIKCCRSFWLGSTFFSKTTGRLTPTFAYSILHYRPFRFMGVTPSCFRHLVRLLSQSNLLVESHLSSEDWTRTEKHLCTSMPWVGLDPVRAVQGSRLNYAVIVVDPLSNTANNLMQELNELCGKG